MMLYDTLVFLSTVTVGALAQSVDLSTNIGSPEGIASGVIYGMPLNDQLPEHFYSDTGLKYGRAGGAQIPAPNRGWSYGRDEYPYRFQAALTNYHQIRRVGGKHILLPHDVWGVDYRTDSYVWPGDNGDWTNYDAFLDQLISDVKANDMVTDLVWDIWNEPDGGFWNGNLTQYLELYRRTHVRLRSDPDLDAMLITGPSMAGYPSTNDQWWTEWASMISANNIVPDQYSWHQEGGGNPADNAQPFQDVLDGANLPQRTININEYATFDEMVAGGYAWYIAKFERLGWLGLLGNWQSAGNLYENLSNLITKTPDPEDLSSTNYTPAAGYWVYNYYTQTMTGKRVSTTSSDDGNCDVFATVGTDLVRILTSCHYNAVNEYGISLAGLESIGYPANGQINVTVTRFNSTGNPFDPVPAPYGVGSFMLNVENGAATFGVFPRTTNYAHTFEFANPSGSIS